MPKGIIFAIVLFVLLTLRPYKPRYYGVMLHLLTIEIRERIVFIEWEEIQALP